MHCFYEYVVKGKFLKMRTFMLHGVNVLCCDFNIARVLQLVVLYHNGLTCKPVYLISKTCLLDKALFFQQKGQIMTCQMTYYK